MTLQLGRFELLIRQLLTIVAAACLPLSAWAQYHSFNVPSGADCIIQDYRSPNLPPGIYDAIYEQYVTSADGGAGYFYGGMVHDKANQRTLVQYVCWPASGGFAPLSQQIPTFAGPNMVGFAQIGEGSSCAIKGYLPLFRTNLWSRFVVRFWQPADGRQHVAFQGMWMKDPVDGSWQHLGTFLYPFAVNGVNRMSGWQENFSGYQGNYVVDHAGGFYHRAGVWRAAKEVSFTAGGHITTIEGNTAARSEVANPALANNVPITVTLSGQADLPTFDPIVVSRAEASVLGAQWLVQWELPASSSPQLGYTIEVFDNPSYSGNPIRSVTDREPETRQRLLDLAGINTPYVRLIISDIFFNVGKPVPVTAVAAPLSPPITLEDSVAGLSCNYYEAASGSWVKLPDFGSLTPALTAAVNGPDTSLRRRRFNYGFQYAGYITVKSNGLYAFTLRSGDGSRLLIDGATVIDFDGLHDSTQSKSGGISLAAGAHLLSLQYFKGAVNAVNPEAYTDGLTLEYEGPGIPLTRVPDSAFSRSNVGGEPSVSIVSPTDKSVVLNTAPGLHASIASNGHPVRGVQFILSSFDSYYRPRGTKTDFYWGQVSAEPYRLDSMIWSAPTTELRARLMYDTTKSIDSTSVLIGSTNTPPGAWSWSPLEMHNYPSGVGIESDSLTLLGDGMNLLSRRVTGDCTLVARLLDLTPSAIASEGVAPASDWRAGIILRGTTNATLGQPLGDGTGTRFAALFSTVGGGTYFQDDTMRAGNGDANRWSSNLGGGNHWYRLQRRGNTFISWVSLDGSDWTLVNSINLPNMGNTLHAGIFTHAVQSFNPNIHRAHFDSFSLTGSNVLGPASVTISPSTNRAIAGLPAVFSATVIGKAPSGYRWQFNGNDIPGATNASYTISKVTPNEVGYYTATANGTTSSPAALVLHLPPGSGVWTNRAGGSWTTPVSWAGNTLASGVDAVADLGTLSLGTDVTLFLNGARTVGTLIFDDANPSAGHNWTLNPGSGGPLTLAVTRGTPAIAVNRAAVTMGAPLAGTQGFIKAGPGKLTLTGASPITGTLVVNGGTLEVQRKSGDVPYVVNTGASVRIGYSTGGGYANTGITVMGDGAESTTGLYLAGGQNYNASGQIVLLRAPTTLRQYGVGTANLGTFDVHGDGLWCSAAASGSSSDPNIRMISMGYGMSARIDAGTYTEIGDFTVRGPLSAGVFGLIKRGTGSLRLNGIARADNAAVSLEEGKVICGISQCLGSNALVALSSGTGLFLGGNSQTVASLTMSEGSKLDFGGAATLSTTNASLAGQLTMTIRPGNASNSSRLQIKGRPLAFGGRLTVTNLGPNVPAAGDVFTLFNAPAYEGAFLSITLPSLPVGVLWDSSRLRTNGTLLAKAKTYTANYAAGPNGTVSGLTSQIVEHGAACSPVLAIAGPGYVFSRWNDGVTANPRQDVGVTRAIAVTALFIPIDLTPPVILPGVNVSNGKLQFQFSGVIRQHYRVEYSPSLPWSGPWTELTNILSLESSPGSVSDLEPKEQRFYRVQLIAE